MKTSTERVKAFRERKRKQELKPFEIWTFPWLKERILKHIDNLNRKYRKHEMNK